MRKGRHTCTLTQERKKEEHKFLWLVTDMPSVVIPSAETEDGYIDYSYLKWVGDQLSEQNLVARTPFNFRECQYVAIADQLQLIKGIKITGLKLQTEIVIWLEQNAKKVVFGCELESLVKGNWGKYCFEISNSKRWGDGITLIAVAFIFEVNIGLWTPAHNDILVVVDIYNTLFQPNILLLGCLKGRSYFSLGFKFATESVIIPVLPVHLCCKPVSQMKLCDVPNKTLLSSFFIYQALVNSGQLFARHSADKMYEFLHESGIYNVGDLRKMGKQLRLELHYVGNSFDVIGFFATLRGPYYKQIGRVFKKATVFRDLLQNLVAKKRTEKNTLPQKYCYQKNK